MKAVMISIKHKWCELIASGKKTVEVRKTKPTLEVPFKCYIYETKGKHGVGKVIGEFVCDEITYLGNIATDRWKNLSGSEHERHKKLITQEACLTELELLSYRGKYAWHISDLKIYDKPKELNEFCARKKCNSCKTSRYESAACMYDEECKVPAIITKAPQSWCYVEELC